MSKPEKNGSLPVRRYASPRELDQRGASMLEYLLVLIFAVIVCVGGVASIGEKVPEKFQEPTAAL